MMLTYISLFSGVGGFDLGFDRAGMVCLAQVEFNPKASAVLQHRWPNVKRFKDVRDVGKHNLSAPDVLCGGFPCQDVSVAGKRAGLDGERSGLWFEYLRIVQELKPRFVVIENVPGLLSSNKGADFAVILRGLAECGYCVAYRILDSKYFGVAQRRRRVFIVASLGNGSSAQILFEPAGSERNPQPRLETGKTVTVHVIKGASIGRKPENGPQYGEIASDGSCYTLNTSEVHAVAGTLAASGAGTMRPAGQQNELDFLIPFNKQRTDKYSAASVASTLAARDYKDAGDLVAYNVTFCDSNGLRKDRVNGGLYVNETNKSNTLTQGAIDHTLVIEKPDRIKEWVETADRVRAVQNDGHSSTAQEHVYFKPNAVINSLEASRATQVIAPIGINAATGESLSPPLTSIGHDSSEDGRGRHAFAITDQLAVRRLTPTECERLQGFPDGWTTEVNKTDSATYTQMGNAVTVNVAEWIGQRIVAVEWAQLTGLAVRS